MLSKLPKIIAHRGASYYAPENTLAAMHKAHDLGILWIEFDVMLSQDGIPVVIHDDSLDRTTNARGKVADTPYSVLANLDAGSWFSSQFAGEKIPSFIELLQCVQELNLGINVEIKPTLNKDVETAQKVVEILQKHWPKQDSLLVSSFAFASLKQARAMDDKLNLGLLMSYWPNDWKTRFNDLSCVSLHVNQGLLTIDLVKEIKKTARYLLAYTVDDVERAAELFDWGVDAVFSNVPDVLQKALG